MRPLYITSDGRFYVDYESGNGTYNVKSWPSQTLEGNRDYKDDAVALANRLSAGHTAG